MRKLTSRLPCKKRSNMPLCRCEYHFVIALRNLGNSRGRLHNATISRNQHERAWKCDDPGGLIFLYDVTSTYIHIYIYIIYIYIIYISRKREIERERKTFDDIPKSCKILKWQLHALPTLVPLCANTLYKMKLGERKQLARCRFWTSRMFLALNPVTHHRIVRSSNPNMSKTEVARLLLWALFEMPIPWSKWWVKGGQLLPLSILWRRDNQFETKWHKPDQPNPTCLLGESGKRRMSSTKHGKSCKSMITQPPHDKKNLKWHRCRQLPTKKLLLGWQWFSWNLLQCYLIIYSPADSHRN